MMMMMTYYQVLMVVACTAWAIAIVWIACLNFSWKRNIWGRHGDVGMGYIMKMFLIGGSALAVTVACALAALAVLLSS